MSDSNSLFISNEPKAKNINEFIPKKSSILISQNNSQEINLERNNIQGGNNEGIFIKE